MLPVLLPTTRAMLLECEQDFLISDELYITYVRGSEGKQ